MDDKQHSDRESREDDRELVWHDPESEAVLERLTEVLAGELAAQLYVFQRWMQKEGDLEHVAEALADEALNYFVIRERNENEPRMSFEPRNP